MEEILCSLVILYQQLRIHSFHAGSAYLLHFSPILLLSHTNKHLCGYIVLEMN